MQQPVVRDRSSWNTGAALGMALGASAWMPTSALASGWPARGIALSLATALLIFITAFLLWRSRGRVSGFQGLMVLLVVSFVAALIFLLGAQLMRLSLVDRWPGGHSVPPLKFAWVLLLYPVLGICFWLQNLARGQRSRDALESGAAPTR